MAEWFKALDLKSSMGESSSGVRIPLPPLFLFGQTFAVVVASDRVKVRLFPGFEVVLKLLVRVPLACLSAYSQWTVVA
jgi:hypothetical protein